VVAERQTAGRGRLGRSWVSLEGGLWLSVVLRSEARPLLSLQFGLAVCQAVEAVSGRPARLKWPNDVMLAGRKAGGVLLESRQGFVVAGIGVNAAVDPSESEEELRHIATGVSREDIRGDLLVAILERLETPGTIRDIRSCCETLGRSVRVTWEGGSAQGVAEALDDQGGLQVRRADGTLQTVWSCLKLEYLAE
ncbi:MAG TPA: biotin--[acetyl-CoA-carboxylase] ligase, partial [Candidatus Xenobia bacterium]